MQADGPNRTIEPALTMLINTTLNDTAEIRVDTQPEFFCFLFCSFRDMQILPIQHTPRHVQFWQANKQARPHLSADRQESFI